MCKLINENKNMFMELTPLSRNDFGVMCAVKLKTEVLCLDFEKVNETDRYMSYENINHIKRELIKLENLDDFPEEELIISIYPIDMFFTMDVFKTNDNLLFIELRFPIGVYTNSKTTGYDFGLDFSVKKNDFKLFLKKFIDSCQNI